MTPARILVVEDEAITAADLGQRLEAMGYEVLGHVATGEQAVRVAGEWHPDLVLMDVRLRGEMDGTQAAEEIRCRCHLPVVYLTAYADADTVGRARDTEPFGYLLKPVQDRELETTIEMALFKSRTEERLRESEERYRALADAVADGVVMHREGIALEVNRAFLDMLGYTREEVIGRHVIDLIVAPESLDTVLERVASGSEAPYTVTLVRKDGRPLLAEVRARNAQYQGRRVRVATVRNLTPRRPLS